MRFALPLALLILVVAALVFMSRAPDVVPVIKGSDETQSDSQRGQLQKESLTAEQLHEAYGASDSRVCTGNPTLVKVSGGGLGETIAGVAQFSVNQALVDFTQRSGKPVDTLRALTLAVDTAALDTAYGALDANVGVEVESSQPTQLLEFDLAGVSIPHPLNGSANVALYFPGHVIRNHSVVTVVVRNGEGHMQDLTDYSEWLLCGEPVDDPKFGQREIVINDVSDSVPGPGVNVMGGEYACAQGWGLQHHLAAGVTHQELANMLLAWGVKTVRLPVNEHCWLADSFPFTYLQNENTGRPYRESFRQLVELLTVEYQMHVVLDLHWTGTMEEKALDLKPLPNREFSVSFWRNVAEQFSHNERVIFNLFNEPHKPAPDEAEVPAAPEVPAAIEVDDQQLVEPMTANRPDSADKMVIDLAADSEREQQAMSNNWWLIWRDGNEQYAGMQSLVDAIRGTGAKNPISVGGLDYSADQRGWLTYAPHDPLGKLWVDNHAYPAANKCVDRRCWEQTLLPLVANGYGVMFGETGNSIGQHPQGCQADFIKEVYRFARDNAIPALAWTFIAGGVADTETNKPAERNCQIPTLITRWPGELPEGDLSPNEITDKRSFDPTPADLLDDATWPGCVFYAYANNLPLDDGALPDIDPAENDAERRYGACGDQ